MQYVSDIDGYIFESLKKSVYLWKNGKICRYCIDKDYRIVCDEFLYIHLQRRKMRVNCGVTNQTFQFMPNTFIEFTSNIGIRAVIESTQKVFWDKWLVKKFIIKYLVIVYGFYELSQEGKKTLKYEADQISPISLNNISKAVILIPHK